MKTNLTIILLLALLTIHGKINQKENHSLHEKQQKIGYSFSAFSQKIPLIALPFSSNCNIELKEFRSEFSAKEISKFGRENCDVFAKLADKKNFTAIIYLLPCDALLPIIVTTDKNGKKISELELDDSYCGEDEFSWGSSCFTINKDLTIQTTDSASSFKRDSKNRIIESTKKLTVTHRQFHINENGKIVERKLSSALSSRRQTQQ